jgi:hypothetical protein
MKKLLFIVCGFLLAAGVSAQTLAKKPRHRSAPVTDQMSVPAFRVYSVEVSKKLAENDYRISDLRFFVMNSQQYFNRKAINKVTDLQKENDELKFDLNTFAKYGIGDWREFQREFNLDLQALSADIEFMHARFMKDYLLANR